LKVRPSLRTGVKDLKPLIISRGEKMGKEKTNYINCRRLALAIFSVVLVLVLCSPAYASPLPGASHVWVNMSNDNGAKFETNGSYYIKFDGGGLNALHLTTDSVNNPSGEVTLTDEQSGTFYVTDTGGRGYSDDTVLMLAVNGKIPDDFRLHVTASGYNWNPVAIVNTLPEVSDLQYVETTLDEWFTAEDFYYGPQTWKPAGTNLPMAYPVFYGQDTYDTDNNFSLMFIDLNAGPVSKADGLGDKSELQNSGGVKVEYSFENLETFAAFNAYAWCNQSNQGRGISWTNRVSGDGSSVYEVNGIPSALTTITVSPGAAEVSVDDTYHFTAAAFDQKDRQMAGLNFEWSSDNEEVGTVDDTGLFTAVSEGTATVTAINGTVDGTTEVTVTAAPSGPEILPDYNHIFIKVANEAGVKYNAFGNSTYNIRFEGINRGLNALHISTNPVVNFGQVTLSENQNGTFYATDSGGKGYEDDIILMVAVNGTIPEDFRLHIMSDGYTWTPNPVSNQPPSPDNVTYQPLALNETFTKEDFRYGPQIWKPTGNVCDYPIFGGQDLSDTENTFRIMFIDLNSGVLRPNAGLENRGAVRINYAFENLETFAAFNVYGYCKNSNNGDNMIAWSNALTSDKIMSGYSVMGTDDPALTSIEITPSSPVLKTGDTLEFSAAGYDQYGNEMTGISFAWESLNTTVGTISQTGLFSAKKTGITVIYAKSGEICGETELVVTPPEITRASIIVSDLKVERGASAMVPILVSGITGVENISGNISWNPDVISVYSAGVNGSDFADSELSFDLTENNLVFSLTSINGISVESPEPVIDVMFFATGNKNDDSEFTVLNATWSNDSQAGLLSPVCGNITITGLKGDFNENDCVDIGDVSKVAYMVASLTPVDPAADFNGNGEVDIGDAARIACFFVRCISSL